MYHVMLASLFRFIWRVWLPPVVSVMSVCVGEYEVIVSDSSYWNVFMYPVPSTYSLTKRKSLFSAAVSHLSSGTVMSFPAKSIICVLLLVSTYPTVNIDPNLLFWCQKT